jgi:hypothetical protein
MNLDGLYKYYMIDKRTEEKRLADYDKSDAGKLQRDAEIEMLEGYTEDEYKLLVLMRLKAELDPSTLFIEIKKWIDDNQAKDYAGKNSIEGNELIALILKGLFLDMEILPKMKKKKAKHRPTKQSNETIFDLLKDVQVTDVSKAAVKNGISRQTLQKRLDRFAVKYQLTYPVLKSMDINTLKLLVYKHDEGKL